LASPLLLLTEIEQHWRPAAGRLRHMDIGDMVIFGGKRFYVRGFDPAGVDPRLVYLEGVTTGRVISVTFDEWSRATSSRGALHLVDEEPPKRQY
jgi:hypothetical protein